VLEIDFFLRELISTILAILKTKTRVFNFHFLLIKKIQALTPLHTKHAGRQSQAGIMHQ
jgi:hypothetical protein